jgi:hypothetical protein
MPSLSERADDAMDVDVVRELTGLSRSAIYQKTGGRHGELSELPHSRPQRPRGMSAGDIAVPHLPLIFAP